MVRYSNHSTAVQGKLNAKVDRTKFSSYSSHRQGEIAALQARPVTSGVNTGDVTIGTANGLSLSGQTLSLQAATNSVPGALTAADHASFAAKQNALTPGVDYLTPTGSAAGLTSFPTLNQNTTGTAGGLSGTPSISVSSITNSGAVDISGAGAGQIKFPATQHASSDVNTLDDYSEYVAASTACTGALTVSVSWKATKLGNVVTLTLPPTVGIASAATNFQYGVNLPTAFRPAATLGFLTMIKDGDINQTVPGLILVGSAGTIKVYKDATATSNFTAGVNAGFGQSVGTSISWVTN
jgi:hypothetical protein